MKKFWKKFKNFIDRPHCWYMAAALLDMVPVYCYLKEGKELLAILWTICSVISIVSAWKCYKMFK